MHMATDLAMSGSDFRLFHGVGKETLLRLGEKVGTETVLRNTVLVSEGARSGYLYLIRQGTIELYASGPESRTTILLLDEGDCFILAAIVQNVPALMSARTVGTADVVRIPAGVFRKFLRTDRKLLFNVAMELASEFRSMVRHLRDQKLRSADQRLVAYLLRLGAEQESPHEVLLPLPKQLIASFLGIRSESLSRAFSDIQAFGVCVAGDRVTIADPARLARFAEIDTTIDHTDP